MIRRPPIYNLTNTLLPHTTLFLSFIKWAQTGVRNLRIIPPAVGICHQVNIEHLAKVVWTAEEDGTTLAFPDSLLGMDSHTPMVNALGVFGWGVGGIEAGAAMLGQPVGMRINRRSVV